ncbi:MAG: hypothetical protein V4576_02060 [Patescibacteria group bacterium]
MTFLLFITFLLCVTYTVLFYFFPFFFNENKQVVKPKLFSYLLIIALSIIGYYISFNIPDPIFANRFLHGFGGGFMAFFTCFLAARDSKITSGKLRFFILSALIVTALGVGNEILECILQYYNIMISADTINDTWLDLISNTTGMLIASMCFVSFISKPHPLER